MPLARNNRIMGANFLNQSCAFDARLQSILLGDPPQNPFSTASVISDRPTVGQNPPMSALPPIVLQNYFQAPSKQY
jgi:hypothetical protein